MGRRRRTARDSAIDGIGSAGRLGPRILRPTSRSPRRFTVLIWLSAFRHAGLRRRHPPLMRSGTSRCSPTSAGISRAGMRVGAPCGVAVAGADAAVTAARAGSERRQHNARW